MKNIFCYIALFIVTVLTAPVPAPAQTTAEKDPLPFTLFKFDTATLFSQKNTSYAKVALEKSAVATGRVRAFVYRVSGDSTPLEIGENYKQNLTQQGFTIHAESENTSIGQICWGSDFSDLCPRAAIYSQGYRLQLKKTTADGDVYVNLIIGQTNKALKTLVADNPKLPEFVLNEKENAILLQVITPKKLTNRMVQEDASYIMNQLNTTGKVDLYGIYFDTDKAAIKPESTEALEQIFQALQQNPQLKLLVGGHTDTVGGAEHNLKLSQARAEAVMAALVSKGVTPDRLKAVGYGANQPVADNATEEGRAKNRRVALVKN